MTLIYPYATQAPDISLSSSPTFSDFSNSINNYNCTKIKNKDDCIKYGTWDETNMF